MTFITSPQLTNGSLFAGIGGFDLGFERAGIKTVWQVEIDPFCRKVLEKHFPHAERLSDIRGCGRHNLTRVDVITGGFPCQDISHAGKRIGIDGERSGLWREMWRIICEIRPQFVVVENVAALLGRGIERVLGDLAAGGYDAEWDCLPACAFGAPHRRDRIFLIAYANSVRRLRRKRLPKGQQYIRGWEAFSLTNSLRNDVANPNIKGLERWAETLRQEEERSGHTGHARETIGGIRRDNQWLIEPNVGRVAHGIPARVDRLKGLGNAVVPQIAEWIGKRIVETIATSLLLVALLTPASPQKTGAPMFVLSEVARKSYGQYSLDFNVTKEHVPTADLYNFATPVSDLPAHQNSEVQSANHPVVSEPAALPSVLDWLFDPGKKKSLADRVMARLVQLEAHEVNLHLKSDYRQAWITLSFALRGVPEPFTAASYAIYGVHPDKVWPLTVADRKARLGAEYFQWYDSADILRPDVPRIPPTATADTHAATGAALPTGTVDGSVPINKEVV